MERFVMVTGWDPDRLALAAQFEPTSPSMLRSMTRSAALVEQTGGWQTSLST